jgi:hypothetical protein
MPYVTMERVNAPQPSGLPKGDEAIGEVLRRAQEIDDQTRQMLEPFPEYSELIHAAEEAGIARDATLQALRERLSLPVKEFEPGTRVFAKSADGHYYAATLDKVQGRTAHLRFVNGSEHVADMTDLKMFSLTPGQKLMFHSSSYGMWIGGEVVRFNRESGSVTITAWYQEETVPLEKVRLNRERSSFAAPVFKFHEDMKFALVGLAGLLAGGAIGAVATWLLTR